VLRSVRLDESVRGRYTAVCRSVIGYHMCCWWRLHTQSIFHQRATACLHGRATLESQSIYLIYLCSASRSTFRSNATACTWPGGRTSVFPAADLIWSAWLTVWYVTAEPCGAEIGYLLTSVLLMIIRETWSTVNTEKKYRRSVLSWRRGVWRQWRRVVVAQSGSLVATSSLTS